MLPNSPGFSRTPDVYADLPVLRGQADPSHWTVADTGSASHGQKARGAAGLDGARPRRAGASRSGKARINGTWPGAIFGVRKPHPNETPLSWAEVHHAVRNELL